MTSQNEHEPKVITFGVRGNAGLASPLAAAVKVLAMALALGAYPAAVCHGEPVRDAAFRAARDLHRLCVIAETDDPKGQQIYDRLQSWLAFSASGLNVQLVRIAADAPDVSWREYGIPSAPPATPVVLLAGRRTAERQSFFIDHWEPEPERAELLALLDSPARAAIRRDAGRKLAVLLYVPGSGSGAKRVQNVVDAVCAKQARAGPLGVSVVRVDRSDVRERLLLSFIGVQPEGPDWLGVVFGPGKFMPPLEGAAITEARLAELLAALGAACTRQQSPSRLGIDLPMIWDRAAGEAVVRLAPREKASGQAAEAALSVAPLFEPTDISTAETNDRPLAAVERHARLLVAGSLGGLLVVSGVAAGALLWQRRCRRCGR